MKKLFTTGIAILLPMVFTLIIVGFLINFLTQPFLEPIKGLLSHLSFFQHSFLFVSANTLILIVSKLFILAILALIVVLIGMLGKHFLIDYLVKCSDFLLHRVPLINRIYRPCREVVHTLFSATSTTFSQVVLVPFPQENNLCMGLIASEPLSINHSHVGESEFIAVFIPGTPNPTVGFMVKFRKEQMIFLNMKVDEAIKCIISCGVVMPEFSIKPTKMKNDE